MPATISPARSRAMIFAAATPHGPRTFLPAAPTSLRRTTPSISCTRRSAWCLATCSTTPASLSGTRPAAPPSGALSTHCRARARTLNSSPHDNGARRQHRRRAPFLSVVIGDALKQLVIKERPQRLAPIRTVPKCRHKRNVPKCRPWQRRCLGNDSERAAFEAR